MGAGKGQVIGKCTLEAVGAMSVSDPDLCKLPEKTCSPFKPGANDLYSQGMQLEASSPGRAGVGCSHEVGMQQGVCVYVHDCGIAVSVEIGCRWRHSFPTEQPG